jgi:Mannosyltransferase (PIG-V)).
VNLRYGGMSDTAKVTSWWIGTRFLTLVVALVGSWAAVSDSDSPFGGYVELWNQWDTRWFESVATEGYVGTYVSDFEDFRYNVAFFPGLPLLMRTAVFIGVPPVFIGMAVSLIAGWVAAMALLRLSQQVGGRRWLAPFAWIVAPTAVFLTAAYTEALFAAFAFWAWAMARERAWLAAGLLAGASAFVRPNAIFLTAGLAVLFVLSRPRTLRGWLVGWPLLLPIAVVLGYFAYLRSLTGSWTAWFDAQRDFWDRQLVDPVTSFMNTYELIFTFSPTGEPSSRM